METRITDLFTNPWVIKSLVAVAGIIIIIFVGRFLQRSLTGHVKDSPARYRVRKILGFAGYLLILFYLAIVFRDRLSGLSVFLGLAGAGVVLALNEVILSLAGGIAIALGNFYTAGDRVKIGGIVGDVIDIGILRTTVMECGEWVKADLPTGRIVRVANSLVFKEPIFNYSADFPFLWDEVVIPVKYGSDYKLAREALHQVLVEVVGNYSEFAKRSWKEVVNKFFIEEAMIDPVITLVFNDNWVELTGRYITNYRKRRDTKDKIFTQLLQKIEASQGKINIASSTLELVNSTLAVQLQEMPE